MSVLKEEIINALSKDEILEIEEAVSHIPHRKSAAIDALKIVQKYRGWISDQSLHAISNLLGMSWEELDSIATFYNLIFRKPVGEKVILFCDSVSCWIMNGESACEHLKKKLAIAYGETTPDNKYTLLPVTCLGDCDHAPAMMVGEELHHDLTPESIDQIFDDKNT